MAKLERQFDRRMIEAEEDSLIDCQFLIQELMVKKAMTRTALAEKVGISKARLSQILSADANPTLKTIVSLVHALGERLVVSSTPCVDAEIFTLLGRKITVAPDLEWKITKTLELTDRGEDADMLAIVKDGGPSNDNYRYDRQGLDPEFFVMEPEAEAA